MEKNTYLYIQRKIHNSDIFLQCAPCTFLLFLQIEETRKQPPFYRALVPANFYFLKRMKHLISTYGNRKLNVWVARWEFWYKFYF